MQTTIVTHIYTKLNTMQTGAVRRCGVIQGSDVAN